MKTYIKIISLTITLLIATLNVPAQTTITMHHIQSSSLPCQEEVSAIQTVDLSSVEYKANPKPWAITLAAVSGASFIAGTSFVSWGYGYAYNRNHYRSDGEGPVDLTAPFHILVGLTFYTVSIGTGIPSIILFKKAKKNTQPEFSLSYNDSQSTPFGIQCQLGVQPGGLGMTLNF